MTFRICSKTSVLSVCLLLLLLTFPLLAATTQRVSVSTTGVQGDDITNYFAIPSISSNGRYVAFDSMSSNLVLGDTNGTGDVFVRDLVTGITERVSISSTGEQGIYGGWNPSINADGRYVAFISSSPNLVPGESSHGDDIFVRDRVAGTTELISISSTGERANAASGSCGPSISADGRYVAFSSRANNLVPGDINDNVDIFVHDRIIGTTELVSLSSDGELGNGDSDKVCISANGRYVAFASRASNLILDDTNGYYNIFVRDRVTNTTEIASVSYIGTQGNMYSREFSISADGRYVAFSSDATNLVPIDTNGTYSDIYIRDRITNTTELVSLSSNGNQGNNDSFIPSISADGRYIAFTSYSNNLVAGDTNGEMDVFVRDRVKGITERISLSSSGDQGNHSSFAYGVFISADGKRVVFDSYATNLVQGDSNGVTDVFVRDRSDAPCNASLMPNSGALAIGKEINLVSIFTDPAGFSNIKSCYLMLNKGTTTSGAGYAFYDAVKNKLYLRKTNESTMIGGFAPGSANVIDNGCIALNCANTTIQKTGNNLTINWNIALKPYFTGDSCTAMMQVTNKTGQADLWETMGQYSVISGFSPVNVSLSPNGGTMTVDQRALLTSVFADPAGYGNIKSCYLMLNTGTTTSGAGYLFYDPAKNKLYLRKTNEAVMLGGFAPGSANVIDNGSVILYCANTTVQKSGNDMTINWRVALKSYFAGNPCKASMQVTNKTGYSDPWEQMGLFSVN